jgi:uncharacterized membrane protein YccC
MMYFLAQVDIPPPGIVVKIIDWIIDPKAAMGGGMMVVMLILLYVVFPSVREGVNSWLKRQEKEQEKEHVKEQNFSSWLMRRTDQLEEERERRMDKVEAENTTLKNRLSGLENDVRIQIIRHEETQQRLRNLEWIFLGEICDELIERMNKQKEDIANRLKEVGQEDLANAVKKEFEKLVEDVRESFLIRNLERTREFMQEKGFFVVR